MVEDRDDYGILLGLVERSLPEKYLTSGKLNTSFAHHLRAHYAPGLSMPPDEIEGVEQWLQAVLPMLPHEEFSALVEELSALEAIRKRYEESPEAVMEAITSQTGRKHRKINAGLTALKPEGVKTVVNMLLLTKEEFRRIPEMEF